MSGPGSIVSIGERFADVRRVAPDAGNAEDRLVLLHEQPFVLALLPLLGGVGEFVEPIGFGGGSCQRSEPITQPALCWMVGRAFVPDSGDGKAGDVERRLQHLQPV